MKIEAEDKKRYPVTPRPGMYACVECGCVDIQGTAWIELNSGRTLESIEPPGDGGIWCPACEDHHSRVRIVGDHDVGGEPETFTLAEPEAARAKCPECGMPTIPDKEGLTDEEKTCLGCALPESVPDVWMQPDESSATAPCGCVIVRSHDGSGDPALWLCGLHRKIKESEAPMCARFIVSVPASVKRMITRDEIAGALYVACRAACARIRGAFDDPTLQIQGELSTQMTADVLRILDGALRRIHPDQKEADHA